ARVRLAKYIDTAELRRKLDHVRTLRVNPSELHYLRGTNEYGDGIFSENYLQFLKELHLPPYELECVDGTYTLEFSGVWCEAIYWKTLALSIINELYYSACMERLSAFEHDIVFATSTLQLAEKIKTLHNRPDITFSDFGTKRRFSRSWQA